jgi:hypothetical protein
MNELLGNNVVDLAAYGEDDAWGEDGVGINIKEHDLDNNWLDCRVLFEDVLSIGLSDPRPVLPDAGAQPLWVQGTPLERVQSRLQHPPPGPFDREDLKWEKSTHNGGEGLVKEVLMAIILWERLEDFVDGEESMHNFPCE